MSRRVRSRLIVALCSIACAVMLPSIAAAQTVAGRAKAVQVTTLGTTVLADTGALAGLTDERDAALDIGTIPSMLTSEVLHAVTVGWPDQVASEASLASLNMAVGVLAISADFVMARVLAPANGQTVAHTSVDGLVVNGVAIVVTGAPNQQVSVPGGQVVINELTVTPSGTTVAAVHATLLGVADVVIASATAGIH